MIVQLACGAIGWWLGGKAGRKLGNAVERAAWEEYRRRQAWAAYWAAQQQEPPG